MTLPAQGGQTLLRRWFLAAALCLAAAAADAQQPVYDSPGVRATAYGDSDGSDCATVALWDDYPPDRFADALAPHLVWVRPSTPRRRVSSRGAAATRRRSPSSVSSARWQSTRAPRAARGHGSPAPPPPTAAPSPSWPRRCRRRPQSHASGIICLTEISRCAARRRLRVRSSRPACTASARGPGPRHRALVEGVENGGRRRPSLALTHGSRPCPGLQPVVRDQAAVHEPPHDHAGDDRRHLLDRVRLSDAVPAREVPHVPVQMLRVDLAEPRLRISEYRGSGAAPAGCPEGKMRLKTSRPPSPDQLRLTCGDESVVIEYAATFIRVVYLQVGPSVATRTLVLERGFRSRKARFRSAFLRHWVTTKDLLLHEIRGDKLGYLNA